MFIFGLGNPGSAYEKTRHNIGFRVVEALREKIDGTPWSYQKKFDADFSTGRIGEKDVTLVKPQTFMNLSGEVAAVLKKYKNLKAYQTLVIYDDKDLPFGSVRIRGDGSSGGHNGMDSLINHLGTQSIKRIRVGIAPTFELKSDAVSDFVLGRFNTAEEQLLPEIIDHVMASVEGILTKGIEAAKTFNRTT